MNTKRNAFAARAVVPVIIIAALAVAGATLAAPAAAATQAVSLSAGTVIPVQLDSVLSSNGSHAGETFSTTVQTTGNTSYEGLPPGTKVEGVVRTATAQSGKQPGALDLSFRKIILPDGGSYPIEGSLTGLDTKTVTRAADGRLVAKSTSKHKRMTYVGIGAGAGIITAILTDNSTSKMLRNALIGGGLGYLYGMTQDKPRAHDVNLAAGSQMGVRLDQPFKLSEASSKAVITHAHQPAITRAVLSTGNTLGIGVMVGNNDVQFDPAAQPIISGGVLLVPAAPVLKEAGVPFTYLPGERGIEIQGAGGTAKLLLGSSIAVINGTQRVRVGAPAMRLHGTTYVPMRFIGLAAGRTVHWDAPSRTAILMDKGDTGFAPTNGM